MRFRGISKAIQVSSDTATQISLDDMIALRGVSARTPNRASRSVTSLPGLANTRLRGRGLDFDEMRPYAEGDDVRHIDWNVTARMGRPYTRLYREERERSITVCLDLRRSMFTGSRRLKAVVACEVAAAILWRVAANGDRSAAVVVDDHRVETSRPALRERGVLDALAVIDRIFGAERRDIRNVPPARPFAEVLAAINRMGRNSGMIVLVSDCHQLDDAAIDELAIAGIRQRLVVMRLLDPLEQDGLPVGTYRYLAPTGSSRATIDHKSAVAVRESLRRRNDEIAETFARHAVPYVATTSTLDATDAWPLLAEHGLV